jgi:outer membrane cobalamin receptor
VEARGRPLPPTPAPPPELVSTETIVVTAAKRRQPLESLPMAVSVVHPEQYRPADASAGTAWLGSEVDGLAMTNSGPGRNRMFLRGVADTPFNGESQATVAVVFDDARLTYAAPDPDIRLVDVDRVEILKGPQGALYGTGALGGIYHIVSNRPDFDEASLRASVGAEAMVHGALGYSGFAVANLPLRRGRAALRVVGYSERSAGWIDTGDRKNANGGRVFGARAELGVDVVDGWRFDLTGFGQWLNSRDSQYVYASGARSRPAQLPEPHDNDLRHASVRLGKRAGNLEITLSSALTWHEIGDTMDATEGAGGFGLTNPRLLIDDRFHRVWDSEARVGNQSGDVTW